MRLGPLRIFWTPPWNVDHHIYRCPFEIMIHTRHWFYCVRPFTRQAWRSPEDPVIWDRLPHVVPFGDTCTTCLHDAETCVAISCWFQHHVRHLVFTRHLWRHHIRHHDCWRMPKRLDDLVIEVE